jgi:citrate synthase
LFTLHAEHELNCSTAAVRHLASSGVDIYSCISGGISALYGPRHGGANEAVLRMLEQIGKKENIGKYIEDVKNKKKVLFGFGHRIYKSYDPRAKIVKQLADEVFGVLGKEPLIEIAQELEKIALTDKYFIDRSLYPNVDFYTGVIYKAMGFPTDMFPVLFSIPRTVGWIAHW